VIDAYFHTIENYICSYPIVVTHEFHLTHLSPFTAYIEGSVVFTDGSQLFFFEFLRLKKGTVIKEKYRYHYVNRYNELIFRYDNAPHHRKIKTFPDHKHFQGKVLEAKKPGLKEILKEIEEKVLRLP